MSLDVTASVRIDAPPSAVAAVQFDPSRDPADRHVGMHALRSPFPMDVDYMLEPTAGGTATIATIRIRGSARGMYGLPGPFLGPMVRRSVAGDLRRLKRIVERREGSNPGPTTR